MRAAFFNYSKLVNLDDENEKDLVDGEIERVSKGFGDEGVERV